MQYQQEKHRNRQRLRKKLKRKRAWRKTDRQKPTFEPAEKQNLIDQEADEETIFYEVGHIQDRDQLFSQGSGGFLQRRSSAFEDDWVEEPDELTKADQISSQDAFDELQEVESLHWEDKKQDSAAMQPTAARRADKSVSLTELSDEDLVRRAIALGVTGRKLMSRKDLIRAIQLQEQMI